MTHSTMSHIRVDDDVKTQANEALAAIGLSMSDAVRVLRIRLLPKVVTHQSAPPDKGGFVDGTAHDDEQDG